MTQVPRPPSGSDPFDDAVIGQLVRDIADGWTMPPVRLDAPSWRDRVRSPGARRIAAARGWLGRVGQAATAAVALTVGGALIAVIVTRPPNDPGKSQAPSGPATPQATPGAQATTLPKLLVQGDLPKPSQVLVAIEEGDYALVDLAVGARGAPITGATRGSQLQVRADGSFVCLCLKQSGIVGDNPTQVEVILERFDPSGALTSTIPVRAFSGAPDPRDEGRAIPEHPVHVLVALTFSDGGRYGFVGWSARAHPVWQSGLLVVDLQSGAVVSELALPDVSTGEGEARQVVNAPHVVGSTAADGLLVGRSGYRWSPATSENATYASFVDAFRVQVTSGQLSGGAALPGAADCGDAISLGGALSDDGTWLACIDGGSARTVVRRLAGDGSLLGDISVYGVPDVLGESLATSADGRTLFAWNPETATLTRIDLATGERKDESGLTARAPGDALTAFGHWLAPVAAAKSLLRGAVVVSPDGTRVYAIGVKKGVGSSEFSGSAGVFAFDAASLQPSAIWQPTADFVSIALSADGRFLYAAGMPGVDERGQQKAQQASITVFDTRDGSQRLIAGELGVDFLAFATPTLD
jgi:hypothetical protein